MRPGPRPIRVKFHINQLRRDGFLRIERGEPAGEIFEFPDIAWPAIALEALEGIGFDTFERQAFGGGEHEEMLREIADILEAFAQRRQPQRDDVQPEKQILAEEALADQHAQILIGRGDDADICLDGAAPPTVVYSPCCSTRKSLVCASIGMSPISSRKRVPPSACSKRPELRVLAPVKAPFSWPNSSDSMRSRGIAAMLMATNGPVRRLP